MKRTFWNCASVAIKEGRAMGLLAGVGMLLASCAQPADGRRDFAAADQVGNGVLSDGLLRYPASDYHELEKGRPGGVLRASVALDTATFDVHASSHGNMQWVGRLLFDCLVYQDEEGRISPWLAKSWEISGDGLTYTFHLRQDVTFSDGTRFDAAAVKANIEHMLDPKTRSPLAGFYVRPYKSGRVIDDFTFEVTLSEPYAPFLDVLAQSWLGMISARQIREAPQTIAQKPIGTGPFILTHYVRDASASFVRRPDYDWSPDILRHRGPAYLDGIELTIIPDALVRTLSLKTGGADLTLDSPPQDAKAIRADPNLVLHSRIRKGNPFRSVTFNVERPPFDDVRIRKAFALSIDREGLAWITGLGELLPKTDFLAANTRFYDPSYRKPLVYDVAEANRILDEAGWRARDAEGYRTRNGKRLSAALMIAESQQPINVPVAIQADARKIGFEVTLDVVTVPIATDRRRSGDFQLVSGGYWHTNTADGLYILYHSSAIPSARSIGQNGSRLRDPILDGLLDGARRSTDPAEQQRLYSKAQERLTEIVPAVPSYESHHMIAYNRRVRGIVFDTSHNTPIFVTAWLDPAR